MTYLIFEKARLKLIPLVQNSDYFPVHMPVSPFLTKMSKNCFTRQDWTVPLSPEPLWETLGMGQDPTQHQKIYSPSPSEKFPLIDLNLSLLKV